tara:strand:- start:2309 stop:2884 length:576 start_codon:yes stop_codon:yes gene_type:complete
MTKKLITFRSNDYQKAKAQGENKVNAWSEVEEQISKVIKVPEAKENYDIMLEQPLNFVMKAIDSEHRPNINIPIKTEKLIELLEIDLNPLKASITKYNKYLGILFLNAEGKVSFELDKELFKVYAENEKELQKLDKSIKLIEAFKDFMKIDNEDFPIHGNHKFHELKQATGHLLSYENGELIPNDYWIKKK